MRWYEYKMEVDDLAAPDDLKAKLLAMTDTLTAEEKAEPLMAAPAPQAAAPAEQPKKKKPIHFPVKQLGTLAACLAVCVLGYNALHLGIGMGSAKSSAPALYAAEGAANSSAASVSSGGLDLQHAALDSAQIIYTANLTLESKDYEAARSALDSALAEAGGYLESSSEYSRSGSSRSVSLTYRVPQASYQSFLDAVAAAGNVTYRSQQAEDVTAQYMDVSARLANLQAQRTRLQQLQAQAEDLSDLLQIEDSLTEVQSQIESWQSQLDWYSDQVQQCTVYIDLNEVQTYTPADEGFFSRIGTAFTTGWSSFVNGLQQLVVALASVWPLAVLACAAVAVALAWRKKHPKK